MTWVKVDDDMPWHRKFRRTGDLRALCLALDLTGMCHAAKYGTDGFIDDHDLPEVLDVLPRSRRSPVLGLLVEVKRWERGRKDGHTGYWVRNYLKYNPSRAQLTKQAEANEQRLAADRERKASARRGKAAVRAASARNPSGTSEERPQGVQETSALVPKGLEKPQEQASLNPPRPAGHPSGLPDPVPSAASPSLVASGASSAAEPHNPAGQRVSGNGTRCRHGNDGATCGVCSPAVGTPPSAAARAELDAVRARTRRGGDTNPTGNEPKSNTTATGTEPETSAKPSSSEPKASAK